MSATDPPPTLDYSANTYITATLSRSTSPTTVLTCTSPPPPPIASSLHYVGPLGNLPDTFIFSLEGIPSSSPATEAVSEVKRWLSALDGVGEVQVQVVAGRKKRGGSF